MENKKTIDKLKELWAKYKKIIITVAIVLVSVYTIISLRPDGYEKLYTGLSETDKQDILVELSKRGVDYKLDETGQTLSVKKENVAWVRQEMTDIGLPSNSSGAQGYDIFMESSLGSTQKDLELRELKARKGQLEIELVRSFPFIETATVNLTIPEQTSLFEKEEKKGTASVTIGFKRGAEITKQQLLGIQHMVSSAIPGVSPESVKVIDNKKGIISDEVLSENEGASSAYEKQMAIEKQTETNIHDDIKGSLSSLFGYDNVQINVNVAINFDEIVQNIEKYDDQGVLRSRNKEGENTVKIDGVENPEAGIDANGEVVGYEVGSDNGRVVYQQKKENLIENFEISKTVETVRKNPELTNTNVVVWVNQSALKEKKIDINQFRQAIGISAGLKYDQATDSFENGQVSVLFLDFEPKEEQKVEEEEEKTGLQGFLDKYGLYIIIGLGALTLIGGVVAFVIAKKRKKKRAEEAAREAAEAILRDQEERQKEQEMLESVEVNEIKKKGGINLIFEDEEDETEEERQIRIKREARHKELNEQVLELSNGFPKETAEYIKKLLKERK